MEKGGRGVPRPHMGHGLHVAHKQTGRQVCIGRYRQVGIGR